MCRRHRTSAVGYCREGQMLVYAHYNIILAGLDDISKAVNYVETSLLIVVLL